LAEEENKTRAWAKCWIAYVSFFKLSLW